MREEAIGEALVRAAALWPDRPALVEGDPDPGRRARWTYAEMLGGAERRAWAFLARFNPGDAVAVWSPNCPEWVFIELGAALAGITLVTVNSAHLAAELEHLLAQSQAKGLILVAEYRGRDLIAVVEQVRASLLELQQVITL